MSTRIPVYNPETRNYGWIDALGVELVKRRVLTNPGEKLYLSLAHSDADIDFVLDAARGAFKTVVAERT